MFIFMMLLAVVLAEDVPIVYFGGWSSAENYNWETNISAPVIPVTNNNPKDKSNSTFIIPSYISGLALMCNASYPIEWNFHQEKWGSHERWMAMLTTRREAVDIYNVSSFRYFAELRFHGDSSSITGNYSCQKIGQTNLESSLYIYWEGTSPPFLIFSGEKQTVYYKKEDRVLTLPCRVSLPEAESNINLFKEYMHNTTSNMVPLLLNDTIKYGSMEGYTLTDLKDPYGHYKCIVENEKDRDYVDITVVPGESIYKTPFNDTILSGASFSYDKVKKQFICCSSSTKPPKMMHFYCDHPTSCKLRRQLLHTIEANSRRRANQNCAIYSLHLLSAGTFRCLGDGIDIVREYFFPIGEGLFSRRRFLPPIYNKNDSLDQDPFYHWDQAVPEKMLTVSARKQGIIYAGENITFDCQVSPYYFSEGLKWGLSYRGNGTTNSFVVMSGSIFKYRKSRFQQYFRRNHGFLKITTDVTLNSVVCIAPVWNTTEWKNTTFDLDIKVPHSPSIGGETEETVNFYVNETMQTLTCQAEGDPLPLMYWKKDNQTLRHEVMKVKTVNATSTVNITRVSYETHGVYTCYAKNVAGTATKEFKVFVHERISSGTVIAVCLSVVGLILAAIATFYMVRKVKDQQNTIKHLTNVAFKDVDPPLPGQSQQPQQVNPSTSNGHSKCISEIVDSGDSASNSGRYQKM